jgi:hypothetical protein
MRKARANLAGESRPGKSCHKSAGLGCIPLFSSFQGPRMSRSRRSSLQHFTLKSGKEIPSLAARSRRPLIGSHIIALTAMVFVIATPIHAEAPPVALEGSWYVLVHYRDAAAGDPEIESWEDKVWVFERRGSRLKWTEYGIVIFDDDRGRFDSLSSGRQVRSEGAWSPDAKQREEIEVGLEVNNRGARVKNLSGSAAVGFRSTGSMQRDSVSVIGYSETWEILELAGLPVFRRNDVMESGRSDSLTGSTQYSATEINRKASIIKGDFDRDGVQKGSFEMVRTGSATQAKLKKSH